MRVRASAGSRFTRSRYSPTSPLRPWISSGSSTIWRTVVRGSSDEYGSCSTIWTLRRTARVARLRGRRLAPIADRPGGRRLERHQQLGQRRLAATGLADEAEGLPAPQLEVDAVDGHGVAVVLAQRLGLEDQLALDRLGHAALVQARDGGQQPLRLAVRRRRVERGVGRLLHDLAVAHDHDPVRDVGDDPEVVGDQQQRPSRARPGARAGALRISAWTVTSSAVVGSSATSTSGASASAIAIIARCAHPAAELVRVVARRGVLAFGDAGPARIISIGPLLAPPARAADRRAPSAIWKPTRSTGFRAVSASWKTIATSRAADVAAVQPLHRQRHPDLGRP